MQFHLLKLKIFLLAVFFIFLLSINVAATSPPSYIMEANIIGGVCASFTKEKCESDLNGSQRVVRAGKYAGSCIWNEAEQLCKPVYPQELQNLIDARESTSKANFLWGTIVPYAIYTLWILIIGIIFYLNKSFSKKLKIMLSIKVLLSFFVLLIISGVLSGFLVGLGVTIGYVLIVFFILAIILQPILSIILIKKIELIKITKIGIALEIALVVEILVPLCLLLIGLLGW